MSRGTIAGIIAACLLVGFMIGINVLPKRVIEQEERRAALNAVTPALQQAAHQAADEAGRKVAKELADKISTGSTKESSPFPDQSTLPVIVTRDAFTITLPNGSMVDSDNGGVSSERLVRADLPDRGSLSIIVCDDRKHAQAAFDDMVASMRDKMLGAEKIAARSIDSTRAAQAVGIAGTIKGEESIVEIGRYEGWEKGLVVIVAGPREKMAQVAAAAQKALSTLRMKQ